MSGEGVSSACCLQSGFLSPAPCGLTAESPGGRGCGYMDHRPSISQQLPGLAPWVDSLRGWDGGEMSSPPKAGSASSGSQGLRCMGVPGGKWGARGCRSPVGSGEERKGAEAGKAANRNHKTGERGDSMGREAAVLLERRVDWRTGQLQDGSQMPGGKAEQTQVPRAARCCLVDRFLLEASRAGPQQREDVHTRGLPSCQTLTFTLPSAPQTVFPARPVKIRLVF